MRWALRQGHSANFNPRSPHGERQNLLRDFILSNYNFNPRSPHGERHGGKHGRADHKHFNPRSPHGERLRQELADAEDYAISIHAPRTGSDFSKMVFFQQMTISIHAPRTGSDLPSGEDGGRKVYFNPRSPHGERRRQRFQRGDGGAISIHAPRTGSDAVGAIRRHDYEQISIHAPRTGSDRLQRSRTRAFYHFNPRSPHGERRYNNLCQGAVQKFQSTLPARGATRGTKRDKRRRSFQSTLPARGATRPAEWRTP